MNLRYLGHSCFLITAKDGTRVLTDPYGDIGYSLPHIRCDAVTVSHSHYDHANVHAVECDRVITGGACTVGGIKISSARSFHDDVRGAKRGINTIFFFEADGVCLAHLGDLGEGIHEELLSVLRRADVILIPVGGNYTIDGKAAAAYVNALGPSYAVPMHFKTDDLNIDIGGAEEFLRAVKYPVQTAKSGVELAATHQTQIILMEKEV